MTEEQLEDWLADVIGVTGEADPAVLGRMTFPYLNFLTRKRGRILWARLAPILQGNFQPTEEGVKKILDDYEREQRGEVVHDVKAERFDRAFRIKHRQYLGPPDAKSAPIAAQPLEGLSRVAAQGVVAFARRHAFPEDVWARDVTPLWRAIQATANQGENNV